MLRISKGTDLGMILMFSNIGITAAVFFLPLLFYAKGISDVEIGFLAIPYSIALFLSNSIFGRLTDSFGRKPFLLLGLASSAITTTLYVVPDSFLVFAIIRFLSGFSLGMFPAAIVSLASDHKVQMRHISSWRALGWTIGAVLNGIIADILQIQSAFIMGGLLFALAFVYGLLRDLSVTQTSTDVETSTKPVQPKYGTVIRHNWPVYLTVIIRHGSGSSIWIYWSLFLQEDLSLNESQIGIVLAINTLVQTLVMRYLGDIGKNPQKMLLLGTFLSAVAFVSFPLSRNFLEISLTQIILGLSFGFFFVGGLRTVEIRGTELGMVGTSTGLFEASFSISQVLGPLIALVVISRFETYTSLMFNAAILTTLLTIWYSWIAFRRPVSILG